MVEEKTESTVKFSEYNEIFYIPNRHDKNTYILPNQTGILKKSKKKLLKRVYKKIKKIGRFTILIILVVVLVKINN